MKKAIKFIFKTLIVIFIILIFIFGSYIEKGYNRYKTALKEMPISEMVANVKQKEDYTTISEVPQIYKDAVIAVEDHRFYEHRGYDILAIIGAIITDITSKELVQGGSTITQQICKNTYFTQERTIERKIAEIYMAAELEKELSKDEILEIYFNTCFYGNNCYTLKQASRKYCNKEPSELTRYEAIMIAGIPNAPSLYNPIASMELAQKRQLQVLYAMVKYEYITSEEKEAILLEGKGES